MNYRIKVTFDNGRVVKSVRCPEEEANEMGELVRKSLDNIETAKYLKFNTRHGSIFIPGTVLQRCTIEVVRCWL